MPQKKKSQSRRAGFPEKPEELDELGPDSGGQSGDLQGLSDKEVASSESVEELVEEGSAWEASAVAGVQDAEDKDGNPREVRTHQVREDDVPEEYLEEDDPPR
jgi:hypothetical protein